MPKLCPVVETKSAEQLLLRPKVLVRIQSTANLYTEHVLQLIVKKTIIKKK